jgi:Mn-dependent DtxR family transcriptional regulator
MLEILLTYLMFENNLQESNTVEFKILMEFLKEVADQKPSTDDEFRNLLSDIRIRPSDFANRLSIPPQTVNSALARMQDKGQIKWQKYKAVELNINQDSSIIHLQNHLHLVQDFLMQSLGLPEQEAYEESLNLASNISCKLAGRICDKYHRNNNHCSDRVVIHYPKCHPHKDNYGGNE